MNRRITVPIVAGLLAVACSKPAPDGAAGRSDEAIPTLPAIMVEGNQALVSPLEAGQRSEIALVRPVEHRQPAPLRRPQSKLTDIVPSMTATTSRMTELAMAPMAPALSAAPSSAGGTGVGAGYGSGGYEPIPDRGPTIIIRGGHGGPDDDCKIHPNGMGGVPMAINSRTPQFGAMGGRRPLVPGRTMSGGFPRGGIH